MLRSLPAHEFGAFAFLLTIAALSWSIWSALFCVPLAYLVRDAPEGSGRHRETIIASASLYSAILISPAFALIAWLLGMQSQTILLFTCFGLLSLVRWFGRASVYLHAQVLRAFASDLAYSLALATLLTIAWFEGEVSLSASYAAMSIAAALGLLPLGLGFLRTLLSGIGKRPLRTFTEIARDRLPWSVLSVVSTEFTDHSHAYVVTLLAGTHGYAPLAATAQLVRPMGVAAGAIGEMERPRFAQLRVSGRLAEMYRSMRTMRIALFGVWLTTAAAILGLFASGPYRLFPESYQLEDLVVGATLWVLVSSLITVRITEGALLQAVGAFRKPALAHVAAAFTSLTAVTILLYVAGPVWSIAGVLLGQLVITRKVWAISRQWRRENPATPVRSSENEVA